ncbi:MAG: hypothetical protein GEU86_05080 [Actinophytocola sp.]|nr:hypothetical protein [Actinophytocola sp.]
MRRWPRSWPGSGDYVAFGAQLAKLGRAAAEQDKPPPWLIPVELVRAFLAALHSGDWLVKLLLITVIVGVWP